MDGLVSHQNLSGMDIIKLINKTITLIFSTYRVPIPFHQIEAENLDQILAQNMETERLPLYLEITDIPDMCSWVDKSLNLYYHYVHAPTAIFGQRFLRWYILEIKVCFTHHKVTRY